MEKKLRVAILDMNEGFVNQGMRGIRDILRKYGEANNITLEWDEFEVRLEKQVPDLSYDIYISSGGPGSPLESEGSEWEHGYFSWLQQVQKWNRDEANLQKKYVFFICHSYQLVCRHFKIGKVCERKSNSFGVYPMHILPEGVNEPMFEGLKDPFYAVDSRNFQVISPNHQVIDKMGASILALEKERPHVPFERAIMAIRFSEYMFGTQFHPEADPIGMSMYLQRDDKKEMVIAEHGEEKWNSMIDQLNDPDKILWTYSHMLPNFLNIAIGQLMAAAA